MQNKLTVVVFRVSHEQRQEEARKAAASRAVYERDLEEFVNQSMQESDVAPRPAHEVLVSPTQSPSSSSVEEGSPSSLSPQNRIVRAWAQGKSLVGTHTLPS